LLLQASAPDNNVLYGFKDGRGDGAHPDAGVIVDRQGVLYGTTSGGGSYGGIAGHGFGTVYKLVPPAKGQTAWAETVLYSFKGGSESPKGGNDGAFPGGLIADKQGALYGTTSGGGSNGGIAGYGFGTVFKLTPPVKGQTVWTETMLYSFKGRTESPKGSVPLTVSVRA